jgi:DNA-3-methyladenine glycosylase II
MARSCHVPGGLSCNARCVMTTAEGVSPVCGEPARLISAAHDSYPCANGTASATTAPRFPMARVSLGAAAESLVTRDPVVASLLAQAGPPHLPRPRGPHFEALVRAIVYQQLAGAAAGAIYGRLVAALGGDVEPERLQALSDEETRAVGLSRGKTASLRDLSSKILGGTVSLSGRVLAHQSDDEVETRVRTVRGVGPWTAQVFMMFRLRRLDIWPTAHLGVRRGYGLAWGVPTPSERELQPLGEPYRPYRTVLTWYCWKAAELYGQTRVAERGRAPIPPDMVGGQRLR